MKKFIITITKRDSSTTYASVECYQIKDTILVIEQHNKKIIIPLRTIEDVIIEKIGTENTPNGEFAGGDQN
jgi:hypothetical protein